LTNAQLTQAKIAVSAAAGAIVYYTAQDPAEVPNFVEQSTFNLACGDYLWVEVFSANHDAYNIYLVEIRQSSTVIEDITLDGRSATGGTALSGVPIPQAGNGVGTPGSSWNDPAIVDGEVWYGVSQEGTALDVEVTPPAGNTTYKFAVAASGVEPVFADAASVTVVNGSYLYIESTSNSEKAYYKLKLLSKTNNTTLTSVTIGGDQMVLGQKGTHSFAGSEAYGNYSDGAELAANNGSVYFAPNFAALNSLAIVAVPQDSSASVTFAHVQDTRAAGFDTGASPLSNVLADDYIVAEVSSALGEKAWYKFQVHIPAVDITVGGTPVVAGRNDVRDFGWLGLTTYPANPIPAVLVSNLSAPGISVTAKAGVTSPTIEYLLGTIPSGFGNELSGYNALPWSTVFPTVTDGSTVIIRVKSPSVAGLFGFDNTQHSAIQIYENAPPKITNLTVGGTVALNADGSVTGGVSTTTPAGAPGVVLGTPNIVPGSAVAGTISLNGVQADDKGVQAVGNSQTTFRYATGATAPAVTAADWKAMTQGPDDAKGNIQFSAPSFTFADQDTFWVEATTSNAAITDKTNYYKFTVNVASLSVADAVLDALQVGGFPTYPGGVVVPNTNWGTPDANFASVVAGAVTLTTDEATSEQYSGTPTDGPNICYTVGPNATGGRVAKTAGGNPGTGDWKSITAGGFGPEYPQMVFSDQDVLWVEVTAGAFTNYYKIVVTVTP
jgi:hypothetical protein